MKYYLIILICLSYTTAYSKSYQYPITEADTIPDYDCDSEPEPEPEPDPAKILSLDIIP